MLHPLAQDTVYRIIRNLDPEAERAFFVDFHDRIHELHELASRERRRPFAQDDIERLDLPIVVGGVALRRPSAGAMHWLRTMAAQWWGESSRVYTFALAYACGHREQKIFDRLVWREHASIVCWAWCLRIRASEEAIRKAALSLLPPPDNSIRWFTESDSHEIDNSAPDYLAIALELSKKFGQTPQYWLWEVSDDEFWGAVMSIHDEADTMDTKHNNPDGWWRRHRRALLKCSDALMIDVEKWLLKRNKAAENG